jgi:uncharacterized protein with von Willebrand factor type A (vWA) domain
MRGAFRQKRQCFLYAFGGPGDVMELELSLKPGVMEKLLAFLRFSFGGGTDVDRPLELSLSRLELNEWKQVMLTKRLMTEERFSCTSYSKLTHVCRSRVPP